MNCRKLRRRQITIQKHQIQVDEIGNQTPNWVDWKIVAAERDSLWGQEYYAAAAVNEENTVVFIIRYAPFVGEMNTVDYRIKFEGRHYDIKHIDYLKDDNRWVKIRVLERGING